MAWNLEVLYNIIINVYLEVNGNVMIDQLNFKYIMSFN